jgi:hypothetical protein
VKFLLIADAFPPLRSSAAIQLRDLSLEFVRQGYSITVMLPDHTIDEPYTFANKDGVEIIRFKTPALKDIGYFWRTAGELLMPLFMLYHWRRSPVSQDKWDGIIWYSPSIFFGPVVKVLKDRFECKTYLIVRDIFPDWAADLNLIPKGITYYFFKLVANFQYSLANTIGVQTHGNKIFFADWERSGKGELKVLHNWLGLEDKTECSISISKTKLAGRRIFVYAGNMGVAQGMEILLDLAYEFRSQEDVGFIFVGRGSALNSLKGLCDRLGLTNVLFYDEIEPEEVPGLYSQCDIGLVALDRKHKTHNIPGKFLSYMRGGLPVLASVNENNDIVKLIDEWGVGFSCTSASSSALKQAADRLLCEIKTDQGYRTRCSALYEDLFAPSSAVTDIVDSLRQVTGLKR